MEMRVVIKQRYPSKGQTQYFILLISKLKCVTMMSVLNKYGGRQAAIYETQRTTTLR